jgi:hypothetical protein
MISPEGRIVRLIQGDCCADAATLKICEPGPAQLQESGCSKRCQEINGMHAAGAGTLAKMSEQGFGRGHLQCLSSTRYRPPGHRNDVGSVEARVAGSRPGAWGGRTSLRWKGLVVPVVVRPRIDAGSRPMDGLWKWVVRERERPQRRDILRGE